MKKLLIVLVLTVLTMGANAQDKKAQPKPAVKKAAETTQASTNYYTMEKGAMVMMKEGKQSKIAAEIAFENGNILTVDGLFIFDKGTQKMMLQEGQRVGIKGNLIEMKGDKNQKDEATEKPTSVPASMNPDEVPEQK